MHIEQTLTQMRQMRLTYMANSLENRLKNADHRDLSHEEFVSLLIEDEYCERKNRKLSRMIGRSGFKPEQACIENIKYSQARGLSKADIAPFTSRTWITNANNLIITGATGTGKTYLAESIGHRAMHWGYSSMKIRYTRLFEQIKEARGTGCFAKYIDKLDKITVLILDDFVCSDIGKKEMGDLLDILEDRDQRGPVIITSQYPISKWHDRFPDPTIADAICDRLIHGAVKINLKGPSMRKKQE